MKTPSKTNTPQSMAPKNWARQIRESDIKGTTLGIALLVATYADWDNGTNVWPGNKRIIDQYGCSKSTVTRAMAELRDKGWIYRVSETDGIHPDNYILTIPGVVSPEYQDTEIEDEGVAPEYQGGSTRVPNHSPHTLPTVEVKTLNRAEIKARATKRVSSVNREHGMCSDPNRMKLIVGQLLEPENEDVEFSDADIALALYAGRLPIYDIATQRLDDFCSDFPQFADQIRRKVA